MINPNTRAKQFALAFLTVVIFQNCKKHDTATASLDWVTGVSPLSTSISQWLLAQAPAIKSFNIPSASGSFVSSSTGGITANDSIGVYIPANAFTNKDGSAYTGSANIRLQSIRTVADMLYSGFTTISGNMLLASGGMFKLEAFDNANNALKLKAPTILTAYFYATLFDTSYKIFNGAATIANNNQLNWLINTNTTTAQLGGGPNLPGAGVGTISFGWDLFTWTNLDQFQLGTPLTDITITLPSGFGDTNTVCAFRYLSQKTCAYIPPNTDLKAFSTQGIYKVTASKAAKIFCTAKMNGQFYYQIMSITSIGINQVINIPTMTQISEADLKTQIATF